MKRNFLLIISKTSENVIDHIVIPMYIKAGNLRSSEKDCALYKFIELVFHLEGEFSSGETEKAGHFCNCMDPNFEPSSR